MAVMTTAQRRSCWAELMSEWSRLQKPTPFTKDVFLQGVEAIDDWISDNAASFNQALPVSLRTNLTKTQKTELFVFVLRLRLFLDT
jgi:hypothetical protein